ncbi:unnamed protein product [Candida verbasci]|uniref:Tetrapyrrole biosynthesis uroporphyrinogen III synthase domain-containing protein n=1 Tax=Candida verbasci TaxID=1227364 RepID=A0A9W4TXV4_9ASCO|nr:unnamed protein product [Candida verbasci]
MKFSPIDYFLFIMSILFLKNKSKPKDPYEEIFYEYKTRFIPLLDHSHEDKAATINYLKSDEFLKVPIFIITSQRAVEMFRECIEEIENKEEILNKIGYTVGPATFKILSDVGFKNVKGGGNAGNGAKLSEIIIDEVDKSLPIVFLTGEIRKDIIPRKLKEEGYNLTEFVIYKTFERELGKIEFNKDDWIVFFSPQGTKEIVKYLKHDNQNWKIASIGPTTEEYLIENNLPPKIVSQKPSPSSLYESISKSDNER